jgi:hypothetical protein
MEADELYGLPFERFVPERGALAKALRADGRREEAAEVAALRKPSAAAWAVNQLVRTQPRGVAELFEAGDALRGAQSDVLAGRGDGRTLRAAAERERAAADALVELARGLLTSDGHELSGAVIERVTDTLHAAALDDDSREQVRHGRLQRELRHLGLGLGDAPAAAPAPARGGARAKEPKERDTAAAERRKTARAAEAHARRRAERAAKALEIARERRDRAAVALDEAEAALASAREEAEAAAEDHARAAEELEGA